jgi:energy-coupling factor transporter ATP-binding protein EcfA2
LTLIKLGYEPKEKYGWIVLKDYKEDTYNNKLVVEINIILWEKVKSIIKIRKKGFDSVILIDGDRRTGKSTLAKTIAYLLNPNMTIKNYVAAMEEAAEKLDSVRDEDVLIFDEGSLIANSKEVMRTKNVQLEKIIDVIGQKKLCLIFCMPTFFSISKSIAVQHSRFLIHTYTDAELNRGRFIYFSTKKKKLLYIIGKKNNNSYKKPKASFNGMFVDFKLPFEDEYNKIKMDSLKATLSPGVKKKEPIQIRNEIIQKAIDNASKNGFEMTQKQLSAIFDLSERQIRRLLATPQI